MSDASLFQTPYWLLEQGEDEQRDFVILIMSGDSVESGVRILKKFLDKESIELVSTTISNALAEFTVSLLTQQAWRLFGKLLPVMNEKGFDVAVLPALNRKKSLLVCDMDSTIVQSETLDDIAEQVGIGEQVSDITCRAMCGELDFRQALNERVKLLTNVEENVINEVVHSIRFNDGAEKLLASARTQGIRSVLVSGGFEPIVKIVAEKLGFDRYLCNRLELDHGRLTGKVLEPIVDKEVKLNVLIDECQQLGIKPEQACSIGDGANDIPMLQAAGLGIGFRGKPLVQASTPYQINKTDLKSVLCMMGIGS